MAKTRTSLKKGQVLNPNGRPRVWETFSFKLKKFNNYTIRELQALDLESLPAKDALTVNQILKAYKKGDPRVIAWISEREDGKVKDDIDMQVNDITARPDKITIEVVKPKNK